MTAPRLPHEIYPAPDEETGTAAEWSTYHLVRACSYSKLLQHVITGDDPLQTSNAVLGFLAEFSQAFLMRRVNDDDARELVGILSAGDVADEMTWDLLSKQGIDPEEISRFATDAERAAKLASKAGAK